MCMLAREMERNQSTAIVMEVLPVKIHHAARLHVTAYHCVTEKPFGLAYDYYYYCT